MLNDPSDPSEPARLPLPAQALLMQAGVGFAVLRGPAHIFDFTNPLYCWMLNRDNLVGKAFVEAMPELVASDLVELFDQVFATGTPCRSFQFAAPLDRGDDVIEDRYLNISVEPIRDADGVTTGLMTVATDTTAQVERTRQLQLAANVGRALIGQDPGRDKLRRCAEAVIADLGVALCRIWSFNDTKKVLELQASAGIHTHIDGPHSRVPLGHLKIGLIAAERRAHLTNTVLTDPRVADKEWVKDKALVAFAGYPLLFDDRLVGVMAVFACRPLSSGTLEALGAVADHVALGIERERSERFRDMFIGMLGHDLRNPLSAIKMGAYTLGLSRTLPDRPREIATKIHSSAERMGRMVTQLLDFTRARSIGGVPLVRMRVNVHEVAKEAVREIHEAHPTRTIHMNCEGPGHGLWDADRLSQVFSNLVGNAVAYGAPERPIAVTIRTSKGRVESEVHNFGPPIPKAQLPGLFDSMRRVHSVKSAGTQGLGLGLFIAKQIVASHGGDLTVTSHEEAGTTFRFDLPCGEELRS